MGKVFLVGAGPGDPELITFKAARALGLADVILVDALVSRSCLAHARPDATVVEVGKRRGCRSTPQAFIERLMVMHARQGRTVVRLKGGDPFVFGRGGEELEALRAAGVEVELVPGVTAGLAAPAALGIPLTHRDLSRGVTFVTGHTHDGAEPDWQALARSGITLVIYMGLKNCARILRALRAAGMDPATPACIIERATLPAQAARIATLGTLDAAGFAGPALIVIGEVVSFCELNKVLERAA
jgi:uroporphyrin-III C-methyltransferase